MIDQTISEVFALAGQFCKIKWSLRFLPLKGLRPTERKRAEKYLLHLMRHRPEEVPPIAVEKDPDGYPGYLIMEGHHRLDAARRLRLDGLWAVVVHDLTPC